MSESKLDLIAKLLAKAESTTPEEAEALTEHAERLMVKYGIEQAMIDERRARSGPAHEKIIESKKGYTGIYARDLREVGIGVAFGLGTLKPLQSKTWNDVQVLHLVGFESDVRQAEILIASLEVQAMVAMRSWWASERAIYEWSSEGDKRRARSGFIRGFAMGARRRIEANRLTIVEEAGTGTELVLASRLDRVTATLGDIGKARSRRAADEYAYRDGHSTGQEANTGERAVAQRKALAQ